MRAYMTEMPPEVLAWRRKTNAHNWDEVWDGVLHMTPMPSPQHQDLGGEIEAWLRYRWARPRGCRVFRDVNLAPPGGWPDQNYRCPDLLLLTPARFATERETHFEGAPDAVVEIRSPGDETYEKLPFYAALGTPEVWVVHRDTKVPEVFVLRGGAYVLKAADAEGWVRSDAIGVELRPGPAGKLTTRLAGDPASAEALPYV
jgi:Uma2 family endonuclease